MAMTTQAPGTIQPVINIFEVFMPVGKFTITMWDRLKWAKAAARETMHMVKPMITTDKKKKANKLKCRTKTFEE